MSDGANGAARRPARGVPVSRRLGASAWIALATAGCRGGVHDAGRLEARWTGLRTGRAAPAATAYWCGAARRLVVTAIHGDTAIGLTVYPAGDTIGGAAPVLDSAAADSVRPRARAALRWLDSVSIPAFEGSAGTVRLARRGGTVAGSFDVTMRSVNATRAGPGVASGSVHVTGRAVAVPVDSGGCNF